MFEYEELTDIIGCSCTLLIPYRGRTEGFVVADYGEDIFDTCQDAIAKWCEKMGISQGDRTDDEMVDFINGYEYENEDTYYYINKFTFD